MNLVLVIEIAYCNQGIESPDLFPKYSYPKEWDKYREKTHSKAGFVMPMNPIFEGQFLFEPKNINDQNLTKLVTDHINSAKGSDPTPLFGGYILTLNERNLLFPQCCGDLSDLSFWKSISEGKTQLYWEGHPQPTVTYEGDMAIFRCEDEYEDFEQIEETEFIVSRKELKQAVIKADIHLNELKNRIKGILNLTGLPPYETQLTFGAGA